MSIVYDRVFFLPSLTTSLTGTLSSWDKYPATEKTANPAKMLVNEFLQNHKIEKRNYIKKPILSHKADEYGVPIAIGAESTVT